MAYNLLNKFLRHRPLIERTSAQSPPGVHPGGLAPLCELRSALCELRFALNENMPRKAVASRGTSALRTSHRALRIVHFAVRYLCAEL
jgi:hypothetical protein